MVYYYVFTDLMYRSANLPRNFFYAGYKDMLGKKFNDGMLKDRVHLKDPQYKQVANYCFQWLNKKHPLPGKAPIACIPPLTTELNAAKIHAIPRKYVEREPEDQDNNDEVFVEVDNDTAAAVVEFMRARKESKVKKAVEANTNSAVHGHE